MKVESLAIVYVTVKIEQKSYKCSFPSELTMTDWIGKCKKDCSTKYRKCKSSTTAHY